MTQGTAQIMRMADYTGGPPDGEAAPIEILTLDQLRDRAQSITWVVKKAIPAQSIGVIFGATGTFKSFVALDLALHVAHGLEWIGRKTTQGVVLFVAAEGGAGLWKRVKAWHVTHGLKVSDIRAHFFVISAGPDLATESPAVVRAAAALEVRPALVVVDTFSQTFRGEENSAGEMAGYLQELGLWFRDSWGAAVLIVHHTGHAQDERPRGSSAMKANVDVMFGVFRDEKEMLATLSCDKMKDEDLLPDASFAMKVVDLAVDADGDPITSLVALHMEAGETLDYMAHEAVRGRGGRHQRFLELALNGIEERKLRTVFMDTLQDTNPETRRRTYNRAKTWAVKNGLIEIVQETGQPATIIRLQEA